MRGTNTQICANDTNLKMEKNKRKIAMTDLETSGDVFGVHEILEIGMVLFDQQTFEILDSYNRKIKPVRIENAVQAALDYNGYNEKDWLEAVSLKEAMQEYATRAGEGAFCAYNATFDWGFINNAFLETGIKNPMSTFENHDRLDLLSIAWTKGLRNEKSWSLKSACKFFGIDPEPEPHNALNGAMTAYKLFKKLQQK